ncbi:MAG: hypothetical protein ACOZCO_14380, partial [Bacteroidota bacterium]
VDPLAWKYPEISPYAGFNNNPILFTDPLGLEPTKYEDEKGNSLGEVKDGIDQTITVNAEQFRQAENIAKQKGLDIYNNEAHGVAFTETYLNYALNHDNVVFEKNYVLGDFTITASANDGLSVDINLSSSSNSSSGSGGGSDDWLMGSATQHSGVPMWGSDSRSWLNSSSMRKGYYTSYMDVSEFLEMVSLINRHFKNGRFRNPNDAAKAWATKDINGLYRNLTGKNGPEAWGLTWGKVYNDVAKELNKPVLGGSTSESVQDTVVTFTILMFRQHGAYSSNEQTEKDSTMSKEDAEKLKSTTIHR